MGVVALDPGNNLLQTPLSMGAVVAESRTADQGILPFIMIIQFGNGDIEFPLQSAEQRFQLASLLFQRAAHGDPQVNDQ